MHQYFHTVLGFCPWDLLALLVLAAMLVLAVLYVRKQKQRQRELEEALAEKQAREQVARDPHA